MNLRIVHKISICGFLAVALLTTRQLSAQNLTLEGQTGGFLTPTAYVVESAKGHIFSHPAISYHFVGSDAVIGDIQTFSITEGFGNRAEIGYTRSLHWTGDSPLFSSLWNYNGMNVFHGKAVLIRDGQFGPAMPGLAIGGVVRLNDHYVSGALNYELAIGADKGFTNGDVYVVATKTWAKPPVPFLLNFGLKMTNGEIFGIGGQATRFGGRLFGGLGIPLPVGHGIVAVPSAGFTQEPRQVKNLGAILVGGKAHIPMTMDYAIRVTQREHQRFAIDAGVGQIAGNIGTTYIASPPLGFVPVNLQARHVIGAGASYRF